MAGSLLTNMQMSAEEAKEQTQPSEAEAPRYPWGLSIHLDDDAMEKLKLGALKVGDVVTIIAKATCESQSSHQTMGGDAEGSCDLQITDMAVSIGSGGKQSMYPNSDLD